MKRLLVTLSLFVVVLGACIAETMFLDNTVSSFAEEIENTIQETTNENIEYAIELSNNIESKWQEKQAFISTFIDHSRLEQIDQSIISMKTNLLNGQVEDFYVEGEVAKSQLNHLRDTELPLIQNIL